MVERDSGELLRAYVLFAMMPDNMIRGATSSVLEPVPGLTRRSPLFGALLALALGLAACGKKADDGAPAQSADSAATSSGNQYQDPSVDFPITEAPPAEKVSGNPFKDVKLFVDPESLAQLRVNALKKDHPDKAAIIEKIAKQPQALWLGEWNTNIYRTVQFVVGKAKALGEVPVFIAYNVPGRDCGQHSAGGLKDDDAYKRWIRRIAAGIGEDSAVVILEPDAIPLLDKCLTPEQQEERLALIKDAVRVLRQNPKTIVYIDGGHAVWKPAEDIAERLKKAGVDEAHGFSLNTSNYGPTDQNIEFGKKVSTLLGGSTHFVIDTSRNGAGYAPKYDWCNPPGRKIGNPPTIETGEPLVDAFLWLKRPGESDGECNGGPKAGAFWDENAIELAK
jgi:endoglucanase